MSRNLSELVAEENMRNENKKLRKALEFYADEKSYETDVENQWEPVVPVSKDAGEKARKALEVSTE